MNIINTRRRSIIKEKQSKSASATGVYLFVISIGILGYLHYQNVQEYQYDQLTARHGRSSIGFIYKDALSQSVKILNSYNELDCIDSSNLTSSEIYTKATEPEKNMIELTLKPGLPTCRRNNKNEFCGVEFCESTKILKRSCFAEKKCTQGNTCYFGGRVMSNYFDETEIKSIAKQQKMENLGMVVLLVVAFGVYILVLKVLITDKKLIKNENATNAEVI